MNKDNQDFVDDISKKLRTQADNLDTVTSSRLQAMRKTVLENRNQRPGLLDQYRSWVIGASVTASLLLVSLVVLNMNSQADLNIMDDLNLLTENQSFEFYEELEFYQWLDERENHG